MKQVSSSAIEAAGYDRESQMMKIRFTGGNVYDFCRVPESVYLGLMQAVSKGRYYSDRIKDRYPCH